MIMWNKFQITYRKSKLLAIAMKSWPSSRSKKIRLGICKSLNSLRTS